MAAASHHYAHGGLAVENNIRPETDVVLIASQLRAEERNILAALDQRGWLTQVLDPRKPWPEEALGSGRGRPVINREIAQTRAAYAAGLLEDVGFRVVNSSAATWRCGDKWLTYQCLRREGVSTPRTTLALTPETLSSVTSSLGAKAVVKPLTGSWGRRVFKVENLETAQVISEYAAALSSPQARILCVQALVDKPDRDVRVVVVGGRALGAIYRSGAWRTNVAQGALVTECPLTPPLAELAVRAAASVGADVAGVDLVEGPDGTLYVIEVNSRVEFVGFSAVHGDELIAHSICELISRDYGASAADFAG